MPRSVALALAAMLAAAPAFAQSAPPPAAGAGQGPTQQTAGDGTSAMAQQDGPQGAGPAPLLIGGAMVGWTAMIGVMIANTENQGQNPASP